MLNWNRFDFIAVIMYPGVTPERVSGTEREIHRIGLDGKVSWHAAFRNGFSDRLANKGGLRMAPSVSTTTAFDTAMAYYRVLKTGLSLGKKSVLVLEEGVRFANDLSELSRSLDSLPSDFDVAKLEWSKRAGDPSSGAAMDRENRWIGLKRGCSTWGCAATAYSTRGLEWKAWMMDKGSAWTDFSSQIWLPGELDVFDNMALRGVTCYLSNPILAVQERFPSCTPGHSSPASYSAVSGSLISGSTVGYGNGGGGRV